MKYDLRAIMTRAWKNFQKLKNVLFAECLHRAWLSTKAAATLIWGSRGDGAEPKVLQYIMGHADAQNM